jgi:hypothetical protein
VDNYHYSRACGYKQSGILPRIEGYGYGMVWIWNGCGYGMVMVMLMEWFWYGYVYGMVFDRDDFGIALESCVIYSHPLCGSHFVVIKLNV